jgi:hypothetical protein
MVIGMTILLPAPVRIAIPPAGPARLNHGALQRLSRSVLLINNDAAPHDVARSARIAVWLILTSIAVLVLLQLIALPTQDPLRGTISGLVYAPAGAALFAVMGARR